MAVVVHVDDQVLRLQVPVYDVVRVQVLEAADHLGGVERHVALYGRVHVPDLTHDRAPFDVLQLKVQVIVVLESAVEADDVWALLRLRVALLLVLHLELGKVLEHVVLRDDVVDVLHLSDVLLAEDLQSALGLRLGVEGFDDSAKVANAHDLVQLKVLDRWLLLLLKLLFQNEGAVLNFDHLVVIGALGLVSHILHGSLTLARLRQRLDLLLLLLEDL